MTYIALPNTQMLSKKIGPWIVLVGESETAFILGDKSLKKEM